MADPSVTRPPSLGATSEANPYVPVSWMAVAAILVAGLFVVLLLFFGYSAAFKDNKPLIMPSLLILPAIGIVLSFAGRRMIRNSEGTRTGENLTASAWWISVVGGLGYFAYLAGIEYSVRSDARSEVKRWTEQVVGGEPDPAFYWTIEPPLRGQATPGNVAPLKARFPDRYLWFQQVDVVRLARRNPGARIELGDMREWSSRPEMIECVFTGVMKCAEGSFPLEIALRGSDAAPGADGAVRQWEIIGKPTGYFKEREATLTPYGWLVGELELSARDVGNGFISLVRQGPAMHPFLYHTLVKPDANPALWQQLMPILADFSRVPIVVWALTPEYLAFGWETLFRLPGGSAASAEQQKAFLAVWKAGGLLPVGRDQGGLLPQNETIDGHAILTITDEKVEVRIPCEMPVFGSGGQRAYRARIVVECTQPEVLADLKRLRAEADPDHGTVPQPPDFRKRQFQWRVVAIESDLVPVSTTAPSPDAGAGGGMPPGMPQTPPGLGGG